VVFGSTWVEDRYLHNAATCFIPFSIFIGPLLWHFEENTTSDPSIGLDLEEVKALAAHIGFEIKVGNFVSVVPFFLDFVHSLTVRTINRYDLR
jgi:N2227-like protein